MKGRLVILSGPSGVGKDTVIDAWRALDPRVRRVVSYTTRAPRAGERSGIDYHFVSEPEFQRLAADGAFLEYKNVHGNFYATPLKDMEAMLDEGLTAVLKIDVQGALAVMPKRPDALTVFLLPPSIEELEERLRARNTESAEALERRLQNARDEIAQANRYQYRVVNDEVERAVQEIAGIVSGARA